MRIKQRVYVARCGGTARRSLNQRWPRTLQVCSHASYASSHAARRRRPAALHRPPPAPYTMRASRRASLVRAHAASPHSAMLQDAQCARSADHGRQVTRRRAVVLRAGAARWHPPSSTIPLREHTPVESMKTLDGERCAVRSRHGGTRQVLLGETVHECGDVHRIVLRLRFVWVLPFHVHGVPPCVPCRCGLASV